MLLFTGGSQFAFVSIIGTGGLAAAPAAIATSSMLGIRNGLYGLQTSRFLGVTGLRRVVAAHLTIDESTAVGIGQPEPDAQRLGFWQTGIAVFVLWNLSTLAGALLGNAFGDPRTLGLDAAAAAAFVALLWPRLRSRDATATAVLAIVHRAAHLARPAGRGARHPRGRRRARRRPAPPRPPRGPARGRRRQPPRIGPDAMTLWVAVVVASVASLLIKLAGYLVPESLLAGERTSRVTTLLPVALLAALVVVQTVVGPGGSLVLDARIVAVGVAIVLLLLRANFLVIVLAAGATAALLRALGWG